MFFIIYKFLHYKGGICVNTFTLIEEIETTRKKLNSMVIEAENLSENEEILKLSQFLDLLLVKYMEKTK